MRTVAQEMSRVINGYKLGIGARSARSPRAAVWVGRGAVAAPREVGWRAEEPVHGGAYLDQNSREGPVRTLATTT